MRVINFIDFLKGLQVDYDKETKQYYIINDLTPGVYGIWDTMEGALNEYFSALKDLVLTYFLDKTKNVEVETNK